jgi:hypothetical protein
VSDSSGETFAELSEGALDLVGHCWLMAVANGIHDAAKCERIKARAGSEVVGVAEARVDAHAASLLGIQGLRGRLVHLVPRFDLVRAYFGRSSYFDCTQW